MTKLKIAALGGFVLAATAVGMAMGWGRMGDPQVVDRPQTKDVPPVAAADLLDLAAAQRQVFQSLKLLSVAMENYREAHGRYPAPAIQGPDGKPLLSWRVAILPYLTEVELYQSFKLDEPWDGPHNKQLLDKMPRLFASPHPPGQAPEALTQLRIFVGKGTPFEGGQGSRWRTSPMARIGRS